VNCDKTLHERHSIHQLSSTQLAEFKGCRTTKSIWRFPACKVQFASQQIPHFRSGGVGKLRRFAHLFIVDFDPKHQHFLLFGRRYVVHGTRAA